MKKLLPIVLLTLVAGPAYAVDDGIIERLATCQNSWLELQTRNPHLLQEVGEHIRTSFKPHGNDAYVVPVSDISVSGMRVTKVYPNSVGMGVGFSLSLDASFDKVRMAMEKALGKRILKCDTDEGMRTCGVPIAEKRSFMMIASDDPAAHDTLVGCFYYYEK